MTLDSLLQMTQLVRQLVDTLETSQVFAHVGQETKRDYDLSVHPPTLFYHGHFGLVQCYVAPIAGHHWLEVLVFHPLVYLLPLQLLFGVLLLLLLEERLFLLVLSSLAGQEGVLVLLGLG